MGSVVILQFLCPLMGYRFRSLRHISAHVPLPGSYIRGEWGNLLFTSSFASAVATIVAISPLL
jgi:hypothetical protein